MEISNEITEAICKRIFAKAKDIVGDSLGPSDFRSCVYVAIHLAGISSKEWRSLVVKDDRYMKFYRCSPDTLSKKRWSMFRPHLDKIVPVAKEIVADVLGSAKAGISGYTTRSWNKLLES